MNKGSMIAYQQALVMIAVQGGGAEWGGEPVGDEVYLVEPSR